MKDQSVPPDGRHAVVEVDDVSLAAKLVDLPCVIGSLKTVDKKTFYKTADISQVVDVKQTKEVSISKEKGIPAKHRVLNDVPGVPSPPTLVQYAESPEVEKEVRRLLCSDAEAVCARWEVIAEGETKEIECQGSIPGFEIAPGISGYKQGHTSPECDVFPKTFSNSSSNSDDEDEDEDEKDDYDDEDEDDREEEYYYEEDLERELQAKFIESGQYEAKEGASSMIMEIHKQTYYMEKKLQEIRCRAQRQKELIMKLENLTLKLSCSFVILNNLLETTNKR
ncbi:transcription initiation factor TFIID subunit 7-like isoform 2 [Camelus ferus]|nr:transcription initiation factor TFIID subunit 7-like isoform 2 [Camelus ferus]